MPLISVYRCSFHLLALWILFYLFSVIIWNCLFPWKDCFCDLFSVVLMWRCLARDRLSGWYVLLDRIIHFMLQNHMDSIRILLICISCWKSGLLFSFACLKGTKLHGFGIGFCSYNDKFCVMGGRAKHSEVEQKYYFALLCVSSEIEDLKAVFIDF